METLHQHQKNRENRGNQSTTTTTSSSSPPSNSSSPSHEFSFTISLHSNNNSTTTTIPDKSKSPPSSSLAIDLSPADDIFFHGHLLPLHLLSHLPSSPRFSAAASIDSFNLLEDEKKLTKESESRNTSNRSSITILDREEHHQNKRATTSSTKEDISSNKPKPTSFSLFGSTRGRKGGENNKDSDKEKGVIHALKRYLRMVLRGNRREKINNGSLHYNSHSGNLVRKNKPELLRGRNGEYSAPASMRASPTNSGLLLAKAAAALPPAAASDSTMEELQAAIQAAIAHCKNSVSKEKLKC